jgi:hypothetical protein
MILIEPNLSLIRELFTSDGLDNSREAGKGVSSSSIHPYYILDEEYMSTLNYNFAGAISYVRGHIKILDRQKLEERRVR